MFLISKIVRGRRLLHELEAQEAKEGGIDLPHLSTKRNQQHRRSSPVLFLEDEDIDASSSAQVAAAARRKITPDSALFLTPDYGRHYHTTSSTPSSPQQGEHRQRMRREAARSQSCRVHPHKRGATPKRSHRISSVASTSIEEEPRKTVRQKTDGGSSFESGEPSNDSGSRASMRRTSSMPSVCDGKVVTATAAAANLRHYDYDRKLNKMQKKALRFTWHRLQTRNGGKRVENVFEEVFDKLVRQLPCIRDMFTTRTFLCAMSKAEMASLRDHAKITVKMLDLIIRNLDTEKGKRSDTGSNLDPRLVGRAHGPLRPYGLTGIFWEKLGETIIDVVLAQEAVRDLPGAGQAWVVLTACLVDQMRAGFDEARNTTFESKHKASVVHHHAAMRLASVDSPEPPHFLTRQQSEDREVQPSSAGHRGYSVDVSAPPRGYCPYSLHHQRSIDEIPSIDDEEVQPSPRGSRVSSRRQTPPTPSSPTVSTLPPSPSHPFPPNCSRSPNRSPSTGSSNIIVHI